MNNGKNRIRRREFVMADGAVIVADVGGNPPQPTVVLMHGGGQTRHSWSGAMRALVDAGYHVINFDARGHGESDWSPDGRYSWTLRAADLGMVLKDVAGPVALVGASMGGITALCAIGEDVRPPAVALIVVDIVPRPNPVGTNKITAFMRSHPEGFATLEAAAEAVSAYNPHRPRPQDVSGLAKNLRKHSDGRYYWHWDPRMLEADSQPDPDALAETLIAHTRKIRVPTLLVRGLASDVVTDEAVREFRNYIPSLEVFDVPGAGHMVAGDRNDAFNDGVIQFLRRHVPLSASAASTAAHHRGRHAC
jgi:pimeloyl-ACP methyl ester carboxylesterase